MKKAFIVIALIIGVSAPLAAGIIQGRRDGGAATSEYVDPSGDESLGSWDDQDSNGVNIYQAIDDATHGGSPGTDDYILNYGVTSTVYEGTFEAGSNSGSVSTFRFHINSKCDEGDDLDIDVSDDGVTWEGYQTVSIAASGTPQWRYTDFTVSWTFPDTIYYRIRSASSPSGWDYVYEVYGETNP